MIVPHRGGAMNWMIIWHIVVAIIVFKLLMVGASLALLFLAWILEKVADVLEEIERKQRMINRK